MAWRHGAVLYRDVAVPVTPLSIYASGALNAVFADQVLVVRALLYLCIATAALLSARILVRLGASDTAASVAALAVVAGLSLFCTPSSLYSPLAIVWFLGMWLTAIGGSSYRRFALAGLLAGLAFCTKQNMGGMAFLALTTHTGLRVWRGEIPQWQRRVLLQAGAFGVTVVLILGPVWLGPGGAKFYDLCFKGGERYMEVAGVRYLSDASLDPIQSVNQRGMIRGVMEWTEAWLALAPLALAGLFLLRWTQRGRERARTDEVLLFTVAGAACMYPRADMYHVLATIPVVIVAPAYLWEKLRSRSTKAALVSGMVCLAVVAIATADAHLTPVYRAATGKAILSDLPYFRGIPWHPKVLERTQRGGAVLRMVSEQYGTPFLVVQDASVFYLTSGVTIPTPYIFPMDSDFGSEGEDEVIESARSGRLRSVCVDDKMPLMPERLAKFVGSDMLLAGPIVFCELYVRPGVVAQVQQGR